MTILITLLLAFILALFLVGLIHVAIEAAPPVLGVVAIVAVVLVLFVALAIQRVGGLS